MSRKSHFVLRKLSSFIFLIVACALTLYYTSPLANPTGSTDPAASKALSKPTLTVGILMPMDHEALREIVSGFKTSLKQHYPGNVEIKVQNAQGDLNIQRSILQQFVRQKVDLVVPIGTQATQMAAKSVKEIPIVSLAASYSEEEKLKENVTHITGVVDEIGPEKTLEFLHELKPNLKKITLVYSNSEKVFPEILQAEKFSAVLNIQVQKLMIQALPELYTVSKLIDKDSEAVFILKDHLIVSGIKTLVAEAEKRNIPVITSDEGSIKEGGTFAIGVKESVIGEEGAVIAAKIFQGTAIQSIPIQTLSRLSLFCNKAAIVKQGLDLKALENLALKLNYQFSIQE